MRPRLDLKTALFIIGAALIGVLWAYYNYRTTFAPDGRPLRGENYLRPLVWAIFATPLAAFLGWLAARPREGWLAAGVCFCIYFFSTFAGARFEAFFMDQTTAEAAGHTIYFPAVMVINLAAVVGVAVWRTLQPYVVPQPEPDEPELVAKPAPE